MYIPKVHAGRPSKAAKLLTNASLYSVSKKLDR